MKPDGAVGDAGTIYHWIIHQNEQKTRSRSTQKSEPGFQGGLGPREFFAAFFTLPRGGQMNLGAMKTISHSATHEMTMKYQYAAITVASV